MATSTLAFQLAALNALKEADQPLETASLILIGTPFDVGPNLKAADFTELSVTGYSAGTALAFGAAYIGPDGKARITAPSKEFQASATVADKQAYGWAVTDAAKAVIHYAKKFDSAVNFSEAGRGVVVCPEIVYGE